MGTGWTPKYRIWGLLLLYISGARRRIAFLDECGVWQNAGDPLSKLRIATDIIEISQPQRTDRFMELFLKAGLINDTENTSTQIWISDEDMHDVADLHKDFDRQYNKELIVLIFPGIGSGPGKRWPEGRYVKVIDYLTSTHDARVFLDGTEQDYPLCKAISAFTAKPCTNLASQHSVRVLCALIKVADLVIASDSGPIHIAAATRTPAIAIFGPTDPRIWAPKSSHLKILRKSDCPPCNNPYFCRRRLDFACTEELQTTDVVQTCHCILSNSQKGVTSAAKNPTFSEHLQVKA